MKSAVHLDTHTVTDIQFQPASLDIWDAKYRLTAKDGSKIDENIDDTYKRVAKALADVEIGSLLAIVHILHAHQVHVFFRAKLRSPEIGAGTESLEARMIAEADMPWKDIAFASTEFALRRFFEDRAAGVERHHFTDIDRRV